MEPIFNFGDQVEFEIAAGSNRARWDYMLEANVNRDGGASGVWARGVVVDCAEFFKNDPRGFVDADYDYMNDKYTYVKFQIKDMIGSGYAAFPKKSCSYYIDYQWNRKGFLRKISRCECGADKVYGEKNNLHSFWCIKKEK